MIRRAKHAKPEPVTAVTAEQYSGTPADVPVKQQVEVAAPSGDVVVVNTKEGQVTFLDKVKAYYHTVITVLGALLLVLNQLTPVTEQFGGDVQKYTAIVILALTALLNFLKSNEVWVNKPGTPSAE